MIWKDLTTLKEPFATKTNSSYVISGITVLLVTDLTGNLFGISLFLLALGSYVFHATEQKYGLWDEVAMYLVLISAAFYLGGKVGLPEWAVLSAPWPLAVIMAAIRKELNTHLWVPALSGAVTTLMLVLNPVLGLSAVLLGIVGFMFRREAHRNAVVDPVTRRVSGYEYDMGHGIWHILSAGALALVAFV